MKLQIKVNDDGIIEDVQKFKTYGCGSDMDLSSSLLTEWVRESKSKRSRKNKEFRYYDQKS